MEQGINIYLVGTAGSGKTALTKAFQEWAQAEGLQVSTVNLDPGAEYLPYSPEVDVRDWVSLRGVMQEHGLGPNGAQIMCADLIALKAEELKEAVAEAPADYIVIDTPGQMELFAYRLASEVVMKVLGEERSVMGFLFDPALAKTPSGFVSLLLLSASVQFRFPVPFINLLAKVDLLAPEELDNILKWSEDYYALYDALIASPAGMRRESSVELLRAFETLGLYKALTPTSSQTGQGMADIYTLVQQVFSGGEDAS